ncbi:acyltransferase [Rathayibacter sp. VKM Ac-2856]|uniref:acyltransferase n=1 Tax=unclassified Rathayibacter TaxID=2609250 RepID=UPI0015647A68|nr:acyltransferase [Rathayibacter sp. VKM Ac-2858]NQX20984.1 acyltransferase [Rathayibacter sp. VKM Ac-2856]
MSGILGRAWRQLGIAAFNIVATHVPSHLVRLGVLRLWGARIGAGTSIGRGTSILDIDRLVIGENCSIGFRCFFDARGGITIGDDVAIASDTHIITAYHLPQSDTFEAVEEPVTIGDHAWLASRTTVVAGVSIGRGAVVGACSLVRTDVEEMTIVAGVPAVVRGQRTSALDYSTRFRRLFY